ncbi:hypothetical protein DSO57_1003087 [Entomophthora muscae]|uniref:Uncharacterized protein n=1 Tax=Entomophthora muscae TaxID=34485 RepID=A0ACC2UIR8_9FUNG|nr:hypothetical protein DSO57_1003087 [Entomophthora muscae]
MQLPNEIIATLFEHIARVPSLLVLASTSRHMRNVSQLDSRLRVLRKCYQQAKIHKPLKCMFSDDMSHLRLEFRHFPDSQMIDTIAQNWRYLPIHSLTIKGDLDVNAAKKLCQLLTTPGFYCNEINFTCVSFNDDENIVQYLKHAFTSCTHMYINLCSLDEVSLVNLLKMVGGCALKSFHFTSNFVDSFPVDVLCEAVTKAPHLHELDVSGAGLGWDSEKLTGFLSEMAGTRLRKLSLTNNDITSVTLPIFPNLRHLNLKENPLTATNHKDWDTNNCPLLAISV